MKLKWQFLKNQLKRIDKFSASTSLSKPSSFQTALKKEMDLFEASGEKSKNLKRLYMILQNIAPTSCASERAFSTSNDFVSKKRSRLSDKSIDNLCFLKGIFKED